MAVHVRSKDIVEELICPVCQAEFDDPRILPCGHCYCQHCIRQLLKHSVPFPCPECRKETVLPSNDPNLLPRALLAVRMKEKLKGQGKYKLCSKHEEPMKLFCNDCRLMVCVDCVFNHTKHDYQPLDVVAKSFAKKVSHKRTALEKQKEALLLAHEANRRTLAEVNEQERSICAKINSSYDELSQILQRRKDELIIESHLWMDGKRSFLDSQERVINEKLTELRIIVDAIVKSEDNLMECYKEVETNIDKKLEECTKLNLLPAAESSDMSIEMICAKELAALAKEQWRIVYAKSTSSAVAVHGIKPTIDVMCATRAHCTCEHHFKAII